MHFYQQSLRFYCGIDLHATSMCRGPQHAALTQEAGEIDGAIDSALASVEENKDKVKRKGLIFDSRDNEYDAAVTTWVASPKAASGESSKKRVKFGNRAK